MNYDSAIASGLRDLRCVREFQRLFSDAEHTIIEGKRDFDPDGWQPVNEWVSRAGLHDRYVVWLVLAIEIITDSMVSELEEPEFYVVEVEKVKKGRSEKGGPRWECGFYQLEEGGWKELVENGGDFATLGLEMVTDAPVKRFATFWRDTRPTPGAKLPPDGLALRAPLRFIG